MSARDRAVTEAEVAEVLRVADQSSPVGVGLWGFARAILDAYHLTPRAEK